MRALRFYTLALLLLLLGLAITVQAQEPVTDDEVNEIAKDLFCPVCENTPLDTCPTQACQDWRDEIRQMLTEGRSEAEIQDYFVSRYGARVLSAPPREGFNWIVWILPVAAVVIGAVVFGRYLLTLQDSKDTEGSTIDVAQSTAPVPPPAADDDDYLSRVEKEVREG